MTLEQCKRFIGTNFPKDDLTHLLNADVEKSLNWIYQKIRGKYDLIITNNCIIELNDGEITIEIGRYKTLSEAVYALIVWAYENKLLEGTK